MKSSGLVAYSGPDQRHLASANLGVSGEAHQQLSRGNTRGRVGGDAVTEEESSNAGVN